MTNLHFMAYHSTNQTSVILLEVIYVILSPVVGHYKPSKFKS